MTTLRIQLYLTPELRVQADKLCRQNDRSLSDLVRDALRMYVDAQADRDGALMHTFGSLPDLSLPSRTEWNRF